MSGRIEITTRDFRRGQTDTHAEHAQEFPGLVRMHNARNDGGTGRRRKGYRVIGAPTWLSLEAISSPSGTGYIEFLTTPAGSPTTQRQWNLDGDGYTVDMAFYPTSVSGTQTIMGPNHASTWPIKAWLSTTTLNVSVHSGSKLFQKTGISANNPYFVRVARRGATIQFWVNGVMEEEITNAGSWPTGWGSGQWYLFADVGATNFFSGRIGWFRVFDVPFMNNRWMAQPYPHTRAPWVKHYVTGRTLSHPTKTIFMDLSPYRFHGELKAGTLVQGADLHGTPAVQGISAVKNRDNTRDVVMVSDGQVFFRELK